MGDSSEGEDVPILDCSVEEASPRATVEKVVDAETWSSGSSNGDESSLDSRDAGGSFSSLCVLEEGEADCEELAVVSDGELQVVGDAAEQDDSVPVRMEPERQLGIGDIIKETTRLWIKPKSGALNEQAQILLRNVYLGVSGLPRSLLKNIKLALRIPMGRLSLTYTIASRLLGIGFGTVVQYSNSMKTNGWKPCRPCGKRNQRDAGNGVVDLEARPEGEKPAEDRNAVAVRNIVRVVIGNAAQGRPPVAVERDLVRYRLAGACVGERLGGSRNCRDIETMAAEVLQQADAVDFGKPLLGIGVASDFGLMADPVSMGTSVLVKYDELMIVCIGIVDFRSGRIRTPMVAGRAMNIGDKSRKACCKLLFDSLQGHPAQFTRRVLQGRLASVNVDGQMARGGPDHRHTSSAAGEELWTQLHGQDAQLIPVNWDRFHRADIAFWRACRGTPAVVELFDLAKQMEYLFGMGDGTALFRAIGEMLGAQEDGGRAPRRITAPGGTRKVAYVTQVPGNMLHNYGFIVQGLWAKVAWKQLGHTGHTISELLGVSRRCTDISFVFFMMLFDDVLKSCVRPFAMATQGVLEPARIMHSQGLALSCVRRAIHALARIRRVFCVAALLRQHAPPPDIAKFLVAYGGTADGILFPSFFSDAPWLLTRAPIAFHGVQLEPRGEIDESKQMCLGPHCQCAAKQEAGGRSRVEFQLHSKKRKLKKSKILVPCWVVAGSARDMARTEKNTSANHAPRFSCRDLSVGRHAPANDFRRAIREHTGQSGTGCPLSTPRRARRLSACSWPSKFQTPCPCCAWRSRCQVPHRAYIIHADADSALVAADSWLQAMQKELKGMFGTVGNNVSMQSSMELAAECWNWSCLLFSKPLKQHTQAFQKLWDMSLDYLKKTGFPQDSFFETVPKTWTLSPGELRKQYGVLLHRVRTAFAATSNWNTNTAPYVVPEVLLDQNAPIVYKS